MSEFRFLSLSHWAATPSGVSTPTTCTLLYESHATTSAIFSETPKYPSVPHLPLISTFAEQPWRVSLTVFSRCQSQRHFHVCASALRTAGFTLVKVNKAELKGPNFMFIPFIVLHRLHSWVTSLCASIVQPLYISKRALSLAPKVPGYTQTTFHLTKKQIWPTAIKNHMPLCCPFCFFSSWGDANIKIKNLKNIMQTLQSFRQSASFGYPNEKLAWEAFQYGSYKTFAAGLMRLIF